MYFYYFLRHREVLEVKSDKRVIHVEEEPDGGEKKKKKLDTYGCSYDEICRRKYPPTWGPSSFTKANHPLQIMVQLASIIFHSQHGINESTTSADASVKAQRS